MLDLVAPEEGCKATDVVGIWVGRDDRLDGVIVKREVPPEMSEESRAISTAIDEDLLTPPSDERGITFADREEDDSGFFFSEMHESNPAREKNGEDEPQEQREGFKRGFPGHNFFLYDRGK